MGLILFTSPTCAPCKKVKGYLADLDDIPTVRVVDVSTDQGLALAQKHGVNAVPTLVATDEIRYTGDDYKSVFRVVDEQKRMDREAKRNGS